MSEAKDKLLAVWQEVKACTKCSLSKYAKTKVFGDGPVNARIMLVGEGPGMDEDRSGHPFVGRAGRILDEALKAGGLLRDRVFIANAVKCHPPKEVLATVPVTVKGNRAPAPDEISCCRPFLEKQIQIIRPAIIVALGGTALNVLGNPAPPKTQTRYDMSKSFKKFWYYDKTPPEDWLPGKAVLIAAYHPQYLGYREGDEELRSAYYRLFRMINEIAEGRRTIEPNG